MLTVAEVFMEARCRILAEAETMPSTFIDFAWLILYNAEMRLKGITITRPTLCQGY